MRAKLKRKFVVNIEKLEKSRLFKFLESLNLINKQELRNFRIRNDFAQMRKEMDAQDAFFLISEKYSVSYETVRTILFRQSRRKN